MTEHDENLGYPAEWGTKNFPHPNPFFPATPRPLVGIGCLPSLLIFPGLPLALGYGLPLIGWEGFSIVFWIFVVGGIGLIYTFLNLNNRIESSKHWRSSRIVPAVVVEPAKGPNRFGTIAALLPLLLSLIIVVLKLFGNEMGRNVMMVKYVLDGEECIEAISLGSDWDKYALGEYIWVVNSKKTSVRLLKGLVPKKYLETSVPIEVEEWLRATMPHEDVSSLNGLHPFERPLSPKDDRIRAKEIKRAAKANTRAMNKELKYGQSKRP